LGADGGEEVVDRPGRIATGVTLVDHAPADVAEVVFAVHRVRSALERRHFRHAG